MGHPKFPKKQFETPKHPWKEERVKSERELMKKYGLKSHREIWKAKTHLGRYRGQARELLAKIGTKNPQVKKESDQLLLHLTRMGILKQGANLDDVLALEIESVLSRRLQTLVYLKGLASTITHSRQLISHGHIAVDNQKVTIPGYMMSKDSETNISFTGRSPLNELSHPARPKSDSITSKVSHMVKDEEPTEKTKTTPQKQPTKKPDETKDKQPEKTSPSDSSDKKEGKTEQQPTEKKEQPSQEQPKPPKKPPKSEEKTKSEKEESTSEQKEKNAEEKDNTDTNKGEK